MNGKPPKSKVAYWKEMGKEHFIKHYKPMSKKSRLDFIKSKYFGGFCCIWLAGGGHGRRQESVGGVGFDQSDARGNEPAGDSGDG